MISWAAQSRRFINMSRYFGAELNSLIEDILRRSEKARESNNVLFANVLKALNPDIPRWVLEYIAYKFPPIGSISRKRRLLQSQKKEVEGKKAERLKMAQQIRLELGYEK